MLTSLEQFNFIDIHYHADPDLYKRTYNALEAGKHYQQLHGAVVLKSHLGATTVQATLAQQQGLPVFPSIVLNKIAGGIHYRPVMQALSEYHPVIPSKIIVHLPTITGRKHKSVLSRQMQYPLMKDMLCQHETIFNSSQKIKSQFIDLLKFANDYPIVLSTGHASKEETYALIELCDKWNVSTLLLNQPANPLTGLTAKELIPITKHPFVWVEQTALTYLLSYQSESDFIEVLRDVPRVIYSSDLGQTSQMDIAEWIIQSQQWFSQFNITQTRKVDLCLTNPLKLLTV